MSLGALAQSRPNRNGTLSDAQPWPEGSVEPFEA